MSLLKHILPRIERLESLIKKRGASGGNTGNFSFAVINANNVDAAITTQSTAVFFSGLTVNRTAVLPPAPITGQEVVVKDADGSLANGFDIIINGNGKLIDGAATYVMTFPVIGSFGAVMLIYNGTSWGIV